MAIIQTTAVEFGALGIGALLVALLHTTLLDVSGILGRKATGGDGSLCFALSPRED